MCSSDLTPPAAAPDASPTPVPRFSRTEVPGCGCAIYAPAGFTFGAPDKSEDQSDVWVGEIPVGKWHFGAIVMKFPKPMDASADAMEEVLVAYLEFLKSQFSITKAVGVGRGHTHAENASARGVIDYWEDKDGDSWAVKGWADPTRLGVMFVYGPGQYPIFNAQQLFLDGFRFQ